MAANPSAIALARPFRRALGGGSAGIGPARQMEAAMPKNTSANAKLSDAQLVILNTAAQRPDGALLPLPESLAAKGASLNRVMMEILCKRKLAEERRTISGAPEWRRDDEQHALGLFITKKGLLALGINEAESPTPAQAAANMPRHRKTAAAKPSHKNKKETSSGGSKPSAAPAKSKQDQVIHLLRRKSGVTVEDIIAKTGWQPHSVRGFLSGLVKKKLKLPLVSDVGKDGVRRYHIAPLKSAKA
jgi:hypothetical protein